MGFWCLKKQEIGQVYVVDRGCDGGPVSLSRLGLNNKDKLINPSCRVQLGSEGREGAAGSSSFHAVADGGRMIFFTTCVGNSSVHQQLFVRLDGSRTLEVSKPLAEGCGEVPCAGAVARAHAEFIGASEDGSSVFFLTTGGLDPGDGDGGSDLYMARIGCPVGEPGCDVKDRVVTSLVQVSHDPNGGAAGVLKAFRLAPDGERVYFTASGDLLDAAEHGVLEGEGRPVPRVGAENLYVYDGASGVMGFVADLCSGKELSGIVEDVRCPNATGKDAGEEQSAGLDGRYLIFGTYAQLVVGDTDAAEDVYRYDAVTGVLERVSVGENGFHANGNDNQFDALIPPGHWGAFDNNAVEFEYEMDNRAVSEDGSRIVFRTAEPLSSAATNHLVNVYEWHREPGWSEGRVSLVSTGNGSEPVEDVVISPGGGDVFFVTSQGLAAQDTDGSADIYDARLGGGFPSSPAERRPCEGDACQGPLTNPAPLLVPGSVSQYRAGTSRHQHPRPPLRRRRPHPQVL